MLLDTHTHLTAPAFAPDLAQVLARAQAAAVTQMIVVGYNLASSREAVAVARCYPGRLFAAVGVHPHEAAEVDPAAVAVLRTLAEDSVVVAIGETGLDYYRRRAPPAVQRRALDAMLALAAEVALPVILHSREALPEVMTTVEGYALPRGGVLHAFAGEPDDVARATQAGLMMSFAGPITYPRAHRVRAAAAVVPDAHVLIETDCPYLPPQPWRGQRNEPAYLPTTLGALAAARGTTPTACAALVTANAQRLFAIPGADGVSA